MIAREDARVVGWALPTKNVAGEVEASAEMYATFD